MPNLKQIEADPLPKKNGTSGISTPLFSGPGGQIEKCKHSIVHSVLLKLQLRSDKNCRTIYIWRKGPKNGLFRALGCRGAPMGKKAAVVGLRCLPANFEANRSSPSILP